MTEPTCPVCQHAIDDTVRLCERCGHAFAAVPSEAAEALQVAIEDRSRAEAERDRLLALIVEYVDAHEALRGVNGYHHEERRQRLSRAAVARDTLWAARPSTGAPT